MMESLPRSATEELSAHENQPESDSLCDRFVTGNTDLDNWIWIIEYFAKFKSELWMLHDIFEMSPKLPDYLGEHTTEMVAFRCLAFLFDDVVVSDSDSKIEFDSSKSCEYVLQCILDEIPLSELRPDAPGLSKWNLLPFIKSKLLCLPKCALELMMEPDSVKETRVSLSEEQENIRTDCEVTDPDLTGRREDWQLSYHSTEDEPEISRSHELVERSNEGIQKETDDHESSPSEKIYRCIQCKESGKLLICSSDGCTVMVHEKCLDSSPPTYDNAGNFYCSICSPTCASAEVLKSQDEIAKAMKKLVSFLSLISDVNKKKSIVGT